MKQSYLFLFLLVWSSPVFAEYELHVVKADANGKCEQGKAYHPDFGTVKLYEQAANRIGVHYCISAPQFERIKQELGEANPAIAEQR